MRRDGKKTLIILSCALTAAFIALVLVLTLSGTDGVSVEKSAPHEAVMTGRNTPPETAAPVAVIDINTASAAELTRLPGIGEKLADAIIAYREKNGAFKRIEDIVNVSGIGEGKLAAIKDSITVGR